jgi:hypothetical protein
MSQALSTSSQDDNPCNRSRDKNTDASNLVVFSSSDEHWRRDGSDTLSLKDGV